MLRSESRPRFCYTTNPFHRGGTFFARVAGVVPSRPTTSLPCTKKRKFFVGSIDTTRAEQNLRSKSGQSNRSLLTSKLAEHPSASATSRKLCPFARICRNVFMSI